jgi:hypothetical protein
MMDQLLSIGADQSNEGYHLGERYHLGMLEGVYYVAYTHEDVRRYQITVALVSAMALYIIGVIVGASIVFANWDHIPRIFPIFTPFGSFFTLLMIAYGNSSRRKWGNRPLIKPRDRHLCVYVYQNGLIKQDNRHIDVIHWPELFKVDYVPPQPGYPKYPSNTRIAGIKLTLHGGHHLNLNGALLYLDDLAYRLQNHAYYQRNTSKIKSK